MISALFLLALSAVPTTTETIDKAIAFMRTAEKKVTPSKGTCAIGTQTRAARMQLELAREVNDPEGARSMAGGLRELAQEANAQCPKGAGADIEKAAAVLEGQKVTEAPEADADLSPEKPPAVQALPEAAVSTNKSAKPVFNPPPTQKPFISSPTTSTADVDTQIAELAKVVTPTFKAVGLTLKGLGRRADWAQPLEAGKCYAFIGVGKNDVRRLALSLWDPRGRRFAETSGGDSRAIMYHCPSQSGTYHLQAKVKKEASYGVGVFAR